jgi:pimeloyl-ACP methyl ester carboxylesterase
MPTQLLPMLAVLAAPAAAVEARLEQVAPVPAVAATFARSPKQDRAVILIHGLTPHPFSKEKANHAAFRPWQLPGSPLVKRLARDSDVFSFCYAQNIAVDEIAEAAGLAAHIKRIKALGYREVVLVGHSAGGVIARQFVEDNPKAGVTKVVQVCAPNAGSGWAALQAVRSSQAPFLRSLTRNARRNALLERDKRIPAGVDFVCVVGTSRVGGDGVVSSRSQWTEDLQKQGVPAYPFTATHWDAMRAPRSAEFLARFVREPQPRWGSVQVATTRKKLTP